MTKTPAPIRKVSGLSAEAAAREKFIPLMRELVRAYQAFAAYDAAHIRTLGLTVSQFDVITELGNTPGMTFRELGKKTLITKGTLTGVIDRLEKKGFVKRTMSQEDRRSTLAALTPKGEQLFKEVFPAQIAHLKLRFDCLSAEDMKQAIAWLTKLRNLF